MEIPSLKKETRYGMPAADHILFNRHYVLGYSYYFRQAKWALEIIDPDKSDIERHDNFRPDFRIPPMFMADLPDYEGSGYDRGHLVASANQSEIDVQNSETFLLSNMAPQVPNFNRKIWKHLEEEVRRLDAKKNIYETYVISGPIFDFYKKVKVIKSERLGGVTLPIPHMFFKSILAETNRGSLHMWSFMIPNSGTNKALEEFQVPSTRVENYAGIKLWHRLEGIKIEREKSRIRKMW